MDPALYHFQRCTNEFMVIICYAITSIKMVSTRFLEDTDTIIVISSRLHSNDSANLGKSFSEIAIIFLLICIHVVFLGHWFCSCHRIKKRNIWIQYAFQSNSIKNSISHGIFFRSVIQITQCIYSIIYWIRITQSNTRLCGWFSNAFRWIKSWAFIPKSKEQEVTMKSVYISMSNKFRRLSLLPTIILVHRSTRLVDFLVLVHLHAWPTNSQWLAKPMPWTMFKSLLNYFFITCSNCTYFWFQKNRFAFGKVDIRKPLNQQPY